MAASLLPIADVTAPAHQGYVVALDGSGTTDAQAFAVKSSNPDITASVGVGPFWTINVQSTDPQNHQNDFSGALTFQLFQDLTPNTVKEIQTFTNDGYYTGKTFHRVTPGFPDPTGYILQAGAPNPDGSGNSGQPGTPYANEVAQRLAYTGKGQLGIANAGAGTNDTQFFVTTGAPGFLSYAYTLFGQLVAGGGTLQRMTQVPVQANPALGGETSRPVNPPVMSSLSLSSANPNGTVLVDMSQARAGESATITVTATDPTDRTTLTRTFVVTAGAYSGPLDPAINFRPLADPAALTTARDTARAVTLPGAGFFPDTRFPPTLGYTLLSQPAHGTIGQFDASKGTLVYTPAAGFVGTDTFRYQVRSTGPNTPSATLTSDPATVTVSVGAPVAVDDAYSVTSVIPLVVAAPGVLANDTGAGGATLTAILVAPPTHGTLTLRPDGSFTYAADAGFLGTDRFTYKANESNIATVNLTVAAATNTGAPPGFDERYYLLSNPDVAAVVRAGGLASGFAHYQKYGQFEGRNPSPYFDEKFYLAANPDVAKAVGPGRSFSSGFDHYRQFGQSEGRNPSPYFDEAFYLAAYPDVAAAVRARTISSGFLQYVLYGQREGRDPTPLFDERYYLASNPDVAAAVASGALESGYEHFVLYGQHEDRNPSALFDGRYYLSQDPKLAAAISAKVIASGYQHILEYGLNEGRISIPNWNESAYLAANPDVASAVRARRLASGFQHYVLYGRIEGRPGTTSP